MNWNYLVGPCCLLFGFLFSLYVKDRASTAAEDTFSKSIKSALAVFKSELMECFDDKYLRKGECTLMMDAQGDRIDISDVRLANLENRLNIQNHPRKANT